MLTAIPEPNFSAKISVGSARGVFLLSPANSNSRGIQFTRRPGNESEEALSNGHHDLQGAGRHSRPPSDSREDNGRDVDGRCCAELLAVGDCHEDREAESNGNSPCTKQKLFQCDRSSVQSFEPIGAAAMRVLQSVEKKAGRDIAREEVRNLPASKTAQRLGGNARRSGVS